MRRLLAAFSLVVLACAPAAPARAPGALEVGAAEGSVPDARLLPSGPRHPFTVDDLLSFDRLGEPSASPDGKLVAFTVRTPDLEANKLRSDVWIASTDGASVRRLTSDPAADVGPRFAPDGKSLVFVSDRGGSAQVWRIAVDGGEATQVTHLPVDVDAVMPFPDGRRLLLVVSVYPDAASLADGAARDDAKARGKTRVRAYDALPVRHWDTWDDGKRSHLLVWSKDGADPVDLMKGLPDDAPPRPFGGLEEVAIAPSGREVVYTAKSAGREAAWSTNDDLWVVPADGSARPRALTADNKAHDGEPVFSRDGAQLAYLAMARPGFESDRQRVVVMDWKTKTKTVRTEAWDRSPLEIAFAPDGRTILATADNLGRRALFAIAPGGAVTTLRDAGSTHDVVAAGGRLAWLHDDLRSPAELWVSDADGRRARAVTHLDDARAAAVAWGEPEALAFPGAHGDTVHGWLVRPPGMKATDKVPVALLIHGGPQGSFADDFHYRWNAEVFTGHGYAALMIDFHGSTGYGQAFTDAIRGDWGGAPFEDLMKGLDVALAKYPQLDGNRAVALGASYGGYMINWINGHTDRFKALVCHDGNLDETSAYYDTEELWFPEWEHGGTPWDNPGGYSRDSPMRFVGQWKTPTLVVHGGRDYRVVDTQGLGTFTALQRRGVPSRLLYFPDENHWVLKPLHSKRWHEEVLAWIDRYAGR